MSSPVRVLSFDHQGHRYVAKAAPIGDEWQLGLWKGDERVRGGGSISNEQIRDARHADPDADLVREALYAIRDAVLTENVRDPEPPAFGDGN